MKRWHVVPGIVALAMVLVWFPSPAASSPSQRSITGNITVTTPAPQGIVLTAAARCAWLQRGSASQGQLGHMVPLTTAEGNGQHRFTLTASSPEARLRISFFDGLGTCAGGEQPLGHFDTGQTNDQVIPEGSKHALIVSWTYASTGVGLCYFPCPPAVMTGGSPLPQSFTLTLRRP